MSKPVNLSFLETNLDAIKGAKGRVCVFIPIEGNLGQEARRVNRLTKGAIVRLRDAKGKDVRSGEIVTLAWPVGMEAEAVEVVFLPRRCSVHDAREVGAKIAARRNNTQLLVLAGNHAKAAEIAMGIALRDYVFDDHKTADPKEDARNVQMMVAKPDDVHAAATRLLSVTEGVFFTRDLVNEPANVLTTNEFANRLEAMRGIGLEIEVLEENQLADLGMGALLSVGEGSESPSKVVVMHWNGGERDVPPLALIGKGVVFDTGGISLKPAAGMEDMTMDMGGAGVVAGVMRALALRKAQANVVGLVGLVENMPSGSATRPGDVVKSMKGDTIEVINTDAEGRLVLCDVMHYAQKRFKPAGMVDLATLTGAIIVGLGHENAGVFSNNDQFCNQFLKAASAEGEGAWRMPLGKAYADQLKSRIADVKNTGGRAAGSVTAAEFLHRFVTDETPWIHLDIAGVASVKSATKFAPSGATGWGVMALDRLVADQYENLE